MTLSVCDPETVPPRGEAYAAGGHVPGELLLAEGGAAQQARDRGAGVGGDALDPGGDLEEREGEGADRVERELDPRVDRDQAGRRDREAALPEVHALHDAEGGELRHPQEEED